jgi:CTP synthase
MTKRIKNPKYVFVVGGVMSGVGKGVATSSIGAIMKARGFNVTALKIDPYINLDAGTMNPTEHGEVFVLDDGDECDQDMGNYERFLNIDLSRINYMTTGRVYQEVIRKERNLLYGGKNVEVVPDIPKEVIRRIKKATQEADADIAVIEVGGTIGEYQNIIFLEAARMMKMSTPEDVMFVMVSYLPIPSKVGEMKTKPTQYASRTLNGTGIQADVIIARSEVSLDTKRKEKIATFCNVDKNNVISAPDVDNIYEVPLNFERGNLGVIISDKLGLNHLESKTNLKEWQRFANKPKRAKKEVSIAVVGKYFDSGDFILSDVYISVLEAIKISSYNLNIKPKIDYLNSESFEGAKGKQNLKKLSKYDGVLIPGGFGTRGIEGKINVVNFVRVNKIPYFGLCYGMQIAVIEFARNVLGIKNATTAEIDSDAENMVIDVMPEQKELLKKQNYGNTMRLGACPALISKGTIAFKAYKSEEISERHRHRYEVNPEYIERLISKGLVFSGKSPDGKLMEIAELPQSEHPFFIATQFHPEFKARPFSPHPLFTAFIKASLKRREQ